MDGKKFVFMLLLFCLLGIVGLVALIYGFMWFVFMVSI